MLWLLSWTIYGIIVGYAAKFLFPGPDPKGFLPTIGIGVVGSYIGGFFNFLLGNGDPFSSSGIIMGVLGGVVFCFVYRKFRLNRFFETEALKEEINALKAQKKENE